MMVAKGIRFLCAARWRLLEFSFLGSLFRCSTGGSLSSEREALGRLLADFRLPTESPVLRILEMLFGNADRLVDHYAS